MADQGAFGSLRLETDTSVGDWAIAGAGEWQTVASVVPAVFPDYARLFHPAWRRSVAAHTRSAGWRPPEHGFSEWGEHEVRWADVAAANGRTAHPAMEWAAITGSWRYHWGGATQPGLWDSPPEEGSLSQRQVAELSSVLARHTSTRDDCCFAIWEGYGDLPDAFTDAPKLRIPNRHMVLFRAPLPAATTSFTPSGYRSPSLWWPADRAWCVGTDVDLRSSYIGASAACVDELINDPPLESMRVTADQWLTADADQVNPEPAGEYPYG
jgi:hypothetical protein